MQSIYWVLTWACHRKCKHCYDDRFRPYVRGALKEVVGEGQAAYERILANLPDDMSWLDPQSGTRQRTTLILAGGELLIDGVREELFYPVLRAIKARWGERAPKISMQMTGDVLTPQILDECLALGVEGIAIASIDDFHVGMKGEKKFRFMQDIRDLMASRGVSEVSLGGAKSKKLNMPEQAEKRPDGPTFLFFGAQEDLWIGELWPRGRAWANGLSNAGYDTNFCARWSGGKNFLHLGQAGSEVAIEPDGSIYPCCLKTKAPLGKLTEERLEDILASVAALPAIQAINKGDPEAMSGDRDAFRTISSATDGAGRTVENMCLGCDRYFEETLGEELRLLRDARMKAKATA